MELYKKETLHRDVSIDNILLGKKADGPEPPPGFCGVLIDLHMAIKVGRNTAKHSADWRSVSVDVSVSATRFTDNSPGILHVSVNRSTSKQRFEQWL
jgi:hypothetical protein